MFHKSECYILTFVTLPIALLYVFDAKIDQVLQSSEGNAELVYQKQPSRGVLIKKCSEICSKFTWEHPCQCVISIKLLSNFIEFTLQHGRSPVNFFHIFRRPFPKNISGGLYLVYTSSGQYSISFPYENLWFPNVFRGCNRYGTLAWYALRLVWEQLHEIKYKLI